MPRHIRNKHFCHLIIVTGIILLFLVGISYAQGKAIEVRVNKVDVSAFPRIRIFASPLSEGKVVPDLTQNDFRVYEDGAQRNVAEMGVEYVGSQIAIVLDASGSFKLPGVTDPGKTRFDEANEAIDELVLNEDRQWIDHEKQRDHLMLMVPNSATEFDIVQDWTNNYKQIHDAAFQSQPVSSDTPLLKMLQESMKRMKDLPDYQNRAKFLLVLSDGVDRISAQEVTDVLRKAEGLGVIILSVKMGPATAGEAKNLQRLAEETGGAYTVYNGPDSLIPLYNLIKTQGWQYVIGYDSAIKSAGDHAGQLSVVREGREYKSELYSIPVEPLPPSVFIADPTSPDPQNPNSLDGKTFDRVTDDWRADLADIEPKGIPISVVVDFPDHHPREIVQVQYEVNGSVMAKLPPSETFFWDFTELDEGTHKMTLIVKVKDALGLIGDSGSVNVTVNVHKPAPPKSGVIAGQIPGGAGDQLILVDESGKTVSSTSVAEDGAYQFVNLPEGTYIVRDMTRQRGTKELAPIYVDGVNPVQIPPENDFGSEPVPPPPKPTDDPWFWIPWVLALAALGFAVFVYLKRPQVVMGGIAAMSTKVQEATEVLLGRRGAYQASASLIPILDAMETRGKPIPLPAQSVFIGRDPARAQITFSDPSVSRLHARIVEESDGVFLLYDEGSSSGTYVNDDQLGHEPVQLKAGDRIEFGRVKVIFVPEADAEVTEAFTGRG